MTGRKPQKPIRGSIYMVDPNRLVLACQMGHRHSYDILTSTATKCAEPSCSERIQITKIMAGRHPHLIWTSLEYGDNFHLYYAIPLTSQTTFAGLPTAIPIRKDSGNGLDKDSFALIHQITPINSECFKDIQGQWIERKGRLSKQYLERLEEQLKRFLMISMGMDDNWFKQNASIELCQIIFGNLSFADQEEFLKWGLDKI
jgi:mRNA interferase MazF